MCASGRSAKGFVRAPRAPRLAAGARPLELLAFPPPQARAREAGEDLIRAALDAPGPPPARSRESRGLFSENALSLSRGLDYIAAPMRNALRPLVLLAVLLPTVSGCGLPGGRIDLGAVLGARQALLQAPERLPLESEEHPAPEIPEPSGSVILGELLAIFPGVLVHGIGHYYAGDYPTAGRLSRIGQFGYVLTAVGGGLGVGGYYLDQNDQKGFAYSLYATGGTVALAGICYLFTAWIYDMVDTPRAVLSGGAPPPRSPFVESLDIFK